MNAVDVENVEPIETVQDVPVEIPDADEIAQKVMENIQAVEQQKAIELENSIDPDLITIDQFITENSETIINFIDLFTWWGFVGIPLAFVVMIFWSMFKEFMYTRI